MKGLIIWIRTAQDSDEKVLDELGAEITDRGGRVEVFHSQAVESLGMEENHRAKEVACAMLASHGVVVIASGSETPGITSGEKLEVREVDGVRLQEKEFRISFMRELELAGLVPPPKYDVHPDEEREIIKKLQDMGYLEE